MARVSDPGKLAVEGSRTVKKSSKGAKSLGTAKLVIEAEGNAARRLRKKGAVKVYPKVVFKPEGCAGKSRKRQVRVVRKRR